MFYTRNHKNLLQFQHTGLQYFHQTGRIQVDSSVANATFSTATFQLGMLQYLIEKRKTTQLMVTKNINFFQVKDP